MSGDQTGYKKTCQVSKTYLEEKPRANSRITTQLSGGNIYHSLQPNSLVQH